MVCRNSFSPFIFILLVLLCVSCKQHKIRDFIKSYYELEEHRDSILSLNFSSIIEADYTEFYVLHGMLAPFQIAEYTGHLYNGDLLEDNEYRFIFFKGDNIVYEETFCDKPITSNYWENQIQPCPTLEVVPVYDINFDLMIQEVKQ